MTGDSRKLKLIPGALRSQRLPPLPETKVPATIYEFGPFRLDLDRHELRRDGRRLHLAPAPMKLLQLFVERPGVLIHRDDIVTRLWSAPGMVDVDDGINTAIRRIRQTLRDDSAKPRYIETVVGMGYRFVADVREIASDQNAKSPEKGSASGVAGPPNEVSLTPSLEVAPVTVQTPAETPLPPIEKKRAVWRRRHFWILGLTTLVLLGLGYFAERMLHRPLRYSARLSQITTNDSEERVTSAAISPDGKWIAYSDVSGLYLHSLQSGRTVALNGPPAFQAERIAWFPDQTRLLVSGYDTQFAKLEIWAIFITGAAPQKFRDAAHSGVPSPDGAKVAFLSADNREIWVVGDEGRLCPSPGRRFEWKNLLRAVLERR